MKDLGILGPKSWHGREIFRTGGPDSDQAKTLATRDPRAVDPWKDLA